MAGLNGLLSRLNKCHKVFSLLNQPKKESIVFMDLRGEVLWQRDVEYNQSGVLAVPQPMSIDEWERLNKK